MTLPIESAINRTVELADQADAKRSSSVLCSAEPGTPIVVVSDAFEAHTGYKPKDVIGRNLSFLQGKNTEPEAVAKFKRMIAMGEAGRVQITNYRADGTEFMHECDFRPVRNSSDQVTHFIAIQRLLPLD